MFDYADSTALVTGASRGIGLEVAHELAARGVKRLILVARSESDLYKVAEQITAHHGTPVEIIVSDLAAEGATEAIYAETERRNLTVDLLINNAGFGSHGRFEKLPLEKERGMVAVNIAALLALTRLYLPGMVARGRGGIVNVGSTAGFQPVPYMATYGATKAFVQSFSEGLWAEMQDIDADVRVVCLCPGGTQTNFGAVVGGDRGVFERMESLSPMTVAKAGLDALETGQLYVVVGAMNYVGTVMPRLFPRAAVARVAASLFRPSDVRVPSSKRPRLTSRNAALGAAILAGAAGVAYLFYGRTREVE